MTDIPIKNYTIVDKKQTNRLIIVVWSDEREGKTHFALTAPGPIFYMGTDKRLQEDVGPKFAKLGKKIIEKYYVPERVSSLEYVSFATKKIGDLSRAEIQRKEQLERQEMENNAVVCRQFEDDLVAMLRTNDDVCRSIVIDNAETLYNYTIKAYFGKVEQNSQYYYGKINGLWHSWCHIAKGIDQATMSHTKNIVVIARQKQNYVNNQWDGTYKPGCWNKLPDDMQMTVRMRCDVESEVPLFTATIENSSHDALLRGRKLVTAVGNDTLQTCDFPHLAQLVFPNTKLEDWQ